MARRYSELVEACRERVGELFPWELQEELDAGRPILLLDVREPYEFEAMHIAGSLNVPRGILEPACEWGYEETVPELVEARERPVVVVCRSGNRSLLAAAVMRELGYRDVRSLRSGLKGWNDFELPLVDGRGEHVPLAAADAYFTPRIAPEQLGPRPAR
ncbi:rhodanese-like domain-containing protein [Inmirania thermothiophila]|uniref:Rhodanese-related sulfurtransferase n=1 Tax=Inmirania thermothiophila TaxID=1750597 RepID=A0A3N1Y0V0_9GAMM|nr:rhodanese-like domain-containing protein [Inmirania thermothiophila]ROR32161.1 rhodanese-related sulfurtransferase [Inmirania thermothiophila]